mgnify:FL=1
MGRKSLEVINQERKALGLPFRKRKKTLYKKKVKSHAILPETKKKRSQEILAVMLSTAGNKVVEKVLSKALDDDDKDQTICLKMVMDRVIPQDYMQRVKSGNKIEIQISGVDSPININEVTTIDGDTVDGEE